MTTQTDHHLSALRATITKNRLDKEEADVYLGRLIISFGLIACSDGKYKIQINTKHRDTHKTAIAVLAKDAVAWTSGRELTFKTKWGARRRAKKELKKFVNGKMDIIASRPDAQTIIIETIT